MGTVINDRPDFYRNCISALRDMNADVIISCGKTVDISSFGTLPENIRMYPYVDQLEVLSKADLFITHCGMNSVSESLYMAAPMILYPQTGEQQAVARRVAETGAGDFLRDDSADGIKAAVTKLLGDRSFADAAKSRCDDLRSCCGTAGAAEFIENAPHTTDSPDPLKVLNKMNMRYTIPYRAAAVALVIISIVFKIRFAWIFCIAAGVFAMPFGNMISRYNFRKLAAGKNAAE